MIPQPRTHARFRPVPPGPSMPPIPCRAPVRNRTGLAFVALVVVAMLAVAFWCYVLAPEIAAGAHLPALMLATGGCVVFGAAVLAALLGVLA